MKKNSKGKLIKNILLSIMIIALCFIVEIFYFNRDVVKRNNSYSPQIVDYYGMKYDNSEYKTIENDSYLILKTNEEDNYVNKIKFNYKSLDNFKWKIEVLDNVIEQKSSEIINLSIKPLDINTTYIKLIFNDKDISLSNFRIDNKIVINYSRVIFMIVVILSLFFIIKNIKKLYNNIEKAYLILAFIIGFLLLLATPKVIGSSLDDNTHLKNSIAFTNSEKFDTNEAYIISESSNTVSSSNFSTQEEQIELYRVLNKNTNEKVTVQLNDYSSKYNKLIYLPFKIGFIIGDIFHLSFVTASLLARLLNYIAYVLLFYFAIKVSTYMKRIIFVFGLSTSSLFLASQFSYDPTIIASLVLAFSLYLRMLEEEKLNYKYIIIFILMVIWASLPKAVYSPFLLLLLFIPNKKFESKKKAIIFKSMVIIIEILMLSTFVLPVLLGNGVGDIRGGNVNPSLQIKFILNHPLTYCKSLFKFLTEQLVQTQFVLGLFMFICNLQATIAAKADGLFLLYSIVLLYAVFTTRITNKQINLFQKIILIIMTIGFLIVIPTTMYLAYTPVGNFTILGVQTRYFIPVFLPILAILLPRYNIISLKDNSYPKLDSLIMVIPYLINLYVVYGIIFHSVGI